MNTKQQLAAMLEQADHTGEGGFLSGNEIAMQLGITRAAIWKCIRQLQEEGYEIEAVRNRGYRLGEHNDALSADGIRRCMDDLPENLRQIPVEVLPTVTSTNDVLKERARELPDWYTLISQTQTKGKGRRTRSFYSPVSSGLYLSMLVRPPVPAQEATRLTTVAAVAACRTIRDCTDAEPGIKWVNDVFVHGKKVCGILTEASVSLETGGLDWAVMGIGFNVYEPEGGFPEEIAHIAGYICEKRRKNLRNVIAASFIRHFYQLCQDLLSPAVVEEYRSFSIMKNRPVLVIKADGSVPAVVEEIDDECRLIVRYRDGHRETLSSGEVSIRMEQGTYL